MAQAMAGMAATMLCEVVGFQLGPMDAKLVDRCNGDGLYNNSPQGGIS